MSKRQVHDLVAALKELTIELGRAPKKHEFCREIVGAEYKLAKEFGNYTALLMAAGLAKDAAIEAKNEKKLEREFRKIVSKREQIHSFYRHTFDLTDLFAKAGNPPSLKVIVQPDTHVKFMDKGAVDAFIKFMEFYDPHGLVILGDFLDCEGISHWEPGDLEPRRLVPEIKAGKALLERELAAAKNSVLRIYIEGNHEHWINQAFLKMPEFFDGLIDLGIDVSLPRLMKLEEMGFHFIPLNELVKIGKAHFTHGNITSSSHAAGHMNKYKTNIYYGHTHDMQAHQQTSVEGLMEAASLGCLSRLDARFLKGRPNNWVHAFGVFEFMPDGTYTRYMPTIVNGRLSFMGRVFG